MLSLFAAARDAIFGMASIVPGDEGGEPIRKCEVELRAHKKALIGLHSYIVVTDLENGTIVKEFLYRAEKDKDGKIGTYADVVGPNTPDYYTPVLTRHKWSKVGACFSINTLFQTVTRRIEADRIEYYWTFQNSNSFTYTLLASGGFRMTEAELDTFVKSRLFPGWGHNLLTEAKR